ncbi:hydroxycinnamoyl-CoA:piscidic acid hydroxycinnamoyltransferase-like [Phragmites australis]|uniref:hydroxycinnamoyl-CoA:piscidic acid hydroxycinnamoyltransferase-like n=1 Tax=Phragmites australis TaxID=29695 RepID=UPI002D770670|nr:hydroxycinnamoyl-CoA:piscidic acid hydroxycinnamoyltransferase-like [Phragmites australis]
MASNGPSARVHIEGLQTAVPTRVVGAGRARPVAVAAPPLPASALQRRARVVLYYRADGAPCGEEAVLVKESLSEALADHPEMAGRLRRHADGSWEVKLNDTGVRLVLATVEANVEDFVGDKDRARREAALAPWTDVNAEDPDVSALCFMQLTRFQGDGGYAVGVSCSLMLCDPLSLARFLLSWARTHAEMKAQNKAATSPMMQYVSYFQRADTMTRRIKSIPLDSFAANDSNVETLLFRAANTRGAHDHRALARACVDQASERVGAGKVPLFSVIVFARKGEGDGPAAMSVETCQADEQHGSGGAEHKLEVAQWQELGLDELVLRESKPVHVSYSIETGGDEGLAVVMPDGAGFLVTATVPKCTN